MVKYASSARKSRSRVGYSRKAIVKRRPNTKGTNKIVSIVKTTLARNLEQKMTVMPVIGSRVSAKTIPGCGLTPNIPGNVANQIPGIFIPNVFQQLSLGQGVHQDQRIGNSVKTKSLSFRGVITSLPTSNVNNDPLPYEVHLLFFKRKKFQGGNIIQAPDDLKQYATNTLIPVEPYLMNSLIPWNRDAYEIKAHRVFRLRQAPVYAQVPPGLEGVNTLMSNAPFFHRFHVTIPIKQNLIFEDGVNKPSNDWLSLGVYVINSNGAALFDGLGDWQQKAAIAMDMVYKYTDA